MDGFSREKIILFFGCCQLFSFVSIEYSCHAMWMSEYVCCELLRFETYGCGRPALTDGQQPYCYNGNTLIRIHNKFFLFVAFAFALRFCMHNEWVLIKRRSSQLACLNLLSFSWIVCPCRAMWADVSLISASHLVRNESMFIIMSAPRLACPSIQSWREPCTAFWLVRRCKP